jgi:hypothetical protein
MPADSRYSTLPVGSAVAACPKSKPAHWIEIKLLDDNGDPLPGERYRVDLPDGDVAEGRLGKDGTARIEGIPSAGTCQVTFPNLDREGWNRA